MKDIIIKYLFAIKGKIASVISRLKNARMIKGISLKTLSCFLAGLIAGLVVGAILLSAYVYREGLYESQAVQAFQGRNTSAFVSGKAEIPLREDISGDENHITGAVSAPETAAAEHAENLPSGEPEAEQPDADTVPENPGESGTAGTLVIVKSGEELPVAAQTGEDGQEDTLTYYQGEIPDEKGNIIILGEDFGEEPRFGIFGRLEKGDTVEFKAPDNITYSYTVYKVHSLKQKDVTDFQWSTDEPGLTMLICSGETNHWLLIYCRRNV